MNEPVLVIRAASKSAHETAAAEGDQPAGFQPAAASGIVGVPA
ncbi:MAG TPA: hypothetical protein PK213_08600 [Deltaproteobacteria bacterium]|nr:hypothetical protein [Deltaproteobacteria bacterium]